MVCVYCDRSALHKRGCPNSRIIGELKRKWRRAQFYLGRDKFLPGEPLPRERTQRLGWDAEMRLSQTLLKKTEWEK